MIRHYYISNNLDDLEQVEAELQQGGIETPQIHVFSQSSAQSDVEERKLHEVSSFTKRDIVRSSIIGFGFGSIAAIAILVLAQVMGWFESGAGWTPFIFLAIVLFGFSAWEGGLRGIQEPNREFVQFQEALDKGRHIFFIDVNSNQEGILQKVLARHPNLVFAGEGASAPAWLILGQTQLLKMVKSLP